ncbi:MAG: Gfo/Idh/MocA family oxidoreductase [Rhizobiaceae bacterium]|nr:Gfo/Idh/MocA family oxidoreductase [Hyphomicrobiales bacterium]NRB30618.1 Gfo/Idh/MocA family oxidoreductase [Rhizobiaceae bacterium]
MSPRTRMAVVGYGLVGRRHVDVIIRSPKAELAAIVDTSPANKAAAMDHGVPVYADLGDMIKAESPDGVILATPTPLHIEQGLACIGAGCPTLIEKPIAVSSNEARLLTDAADKAGVPLLVGHHRRHNGMVQAAKSAIESGIIGDIRAVQATCWFFKPDYYFEEAPWRTKKGAGPISVNLVHDVDLLRHFCGEVVSVNAVAAPSRRGFENEDLATAVLVFSSGTIATISVSDSIVAPWSWELTARENPAYPATSESCYLIGGSKGGLSLPDLRVWQHEQQPDWWTPISANNLRCKTDDPLVVQMEHFVEVINGRQKPLVTGWEGLKSLEVVEAITRSSQLGREVSISEKRAA